jgi:uncharacterized protein
MSACTTAPTMCVVVMVSPGPRQLIERSLDVAPGTTAQAALEYLAASVSGSAGAAATSTSKAPNLPNSNTDDWAQACQCALQGEWSVALWSRKVGLAQVLRDGDRLELCRPLLVDPMVARRERFSSQGARGAGLFSKRRAGAKAGY